MEGSGKGETRGGEREEEQKVSPQNLLHSRGGRHTSPCALLEQGHRSDPLWVLGGERERERVWSDDNRHEPLSACTCTCEGCCSDLRKEFRDMHVHVCVLHYPLTLPPSLHKLPYFTLSLPHLSQLPPSPSPSSLFLSPPPTLL